LQVVLTMAAVKNTTTGITQLVRARGIVAADQA
jgi:hypothetical protein